MYICSSCDATSVRWAGKCENCGEWNTLQKQDKPSGKKKSGSFHRAERLKPVLFSSVSLDGSRRFEVGNEELDQVLGGGFVKGSVVLLSGDPGIGKSTLVLQLLDSLAKQIGVLYVSGEESVEQVAMRAKRLGSKEDIQFAAENDVDSIVDHMFSKKVDFLVIDSIQTVVSADVQSSAGSISQVRECSSKIIQATKSTGTTVLLIGHVNKGGNLAGPKVLEHLVDVVLYLEGDRYHSLRLLRGIKNRFGSTNETGVFEMQESGLQPVKNPSQLFLAERAQNASGSVVTAVLEGNRVFLLEVQALATKSHFGYPKRTSSGLNLQRLELMIAVLTKRAGLRLDQFDVYVNVVGGFKVSEPATDLAVCLAIASSMKDQAIGTDVMVTGEVGLSGEVRSVSQADKRIKEAQKLGFETVVVPSYTKAKSKKGVMKVSSVVDAVKRFL